MYNFKLVDQLNDNTVYSSVNLILIGTKSL